MLEFETEARSFSLHYSCLQKPAFLCCITNLITCLVSQCAGFVSSASTKRYHTELIQIIFSLKHSWWLLAKSILLSVVFGALKQAYMIKQ